MKTLEIIHLRLAAHSPQALVDVVRDCVDGEPDPLEVRVYHHARLETDLAVHLHHDVAGRSDQASDLGMRLAALLRGYGMVEHSVWIEADGLADPSTADEEGHEESENRR